MADSITQTFLSGVKDCEEFEEAVDIGKKFFRKNLACWRICLRDNSKSIIRIAKTRR